MCEQASLKGPEIIELCGQIVPAQQEEIVVMKAILDASRILERTTAAGCRAAFK